MPQCDFGMKRAADQAGKNMDQAENIIGRPSVAAPFASFLDGYSG